MVHFASTLFALASLSSVSADAAPAPVAKRALNDYDILTSVYYEEYGSTALPLSYVSYIATATQYYDIIATATAFGDVTDLYDSRYADGDGPIPLSVLVSLATATQRDAEATATATSNSDSTATATTTSDSDSTGTRNAGNKNDIYSLGFASGVFFIAFTMANLA